MLLRIFAKVTNLNNNSMLKHLILFLFFQVPSFVMASECLLTQKADDFIELTVGIFDPTLGHEGQPKSPIDPPSISLDDHTLYFSTPCDGCTLNIVDSNDVVVYTTVIPTGTTSLVLPATLSGEYELQIISGNYLFYGTIDLP